MADDTNLKGHVATYDGLIGLMKWGAVAVAVIVTAVILLIAR
ncbi:aa3-type cytochrome c oxidase subunit IV [uncultured Sphingomonas sp.]